MPSFYVAPDDVQGQTLQLVGEEAHHAIRVAHYRVGDSICAIDGRGVWHRAVIERIERGEVVGHGGQ